MSADVMFEWIPQNGGNAEQFIHTDTNESSEITTAAGHQQRGSLIFKYLRPCVSEVLRQWQSALRSVARVKRGILRAVENPSNILIIEIYMRTPLKHRNTPHQLVVCYTRFRS